MSNIVIMKSTYHDNYKQNKNKIKIKYLFDRCRYGIGIKNYYLIVLYLRLLSYNTT